MLASLASYSRRINLAASTTALAYVEKREKEGKEKGGGKRGGEGMRPPCMFELGGVMCVTVLTGCIHIKRGLLSTAALSL